MAKKTTMEHPAEYPAAAPAKSGKAFKVVVPNRAFNGQRGGVSFREGVGVTSDEKAARWCMDQGYEVGEVRE